MDGAARAERSRKTNKLRLAKLAQIEGLRADADERLSDISNQEFLVAGLALYAAESGKTDGEVAFANTDPRMILFFCTWLRRFFCRRRVAIEASAVPA